ncbi:MAG TPA: hypothetical protein VMT76_00680 [Puia sp.]|nr:hypothetical protein [Puia sp.]
MSKILKLLRLKHYDTIVAAFAGFLIIYAYTSHSGIGISPDSVVYLSTARNIHAHHGFVDFDNRPLVIFPLLYPIFLSFVMLITSLDPMSFAPLLNGCLFAIFIYMAGRMMERFVNHSRWYQQIALFTLTLSPCLLEIYSMLWSETLFLILLLSFIIFLNKYLNFPAVKNLLFVAMVTGLACVLRYAGITLIATGIGMIVLSFNMPLRKKIPHAFLFAVISSSFLVLNLVLNHIHSSTLTGNREKSITSLFDNIYYFGYVMCDWLPLPENNYTIALITASALIIVFSVVFFRRYFGKIHFESYENISTGFFAFYGLFMILSATFSRYETFSSRLVSPAFIPMVWGGSSMIMLYRDSVSPKRRLWVTVITLFIFGCFQVNQLKDDFENWDGIKDAGVPGYTEDPWNKDSEIVNFLRENYKSFHPAYSRYSNSDEAVYFYTGLSCHMLPHKQSNDEKKDFYSSGKCYLIWFDDTNNSDLISLEEAVQHRNMAILYQFSNGAIYISTDKREIAAKASR